MKTNAIVRIVIWSLTILVLLAILLSGLSLRDGIRLSFHEEQPAATEPVKPLPNGEDVTLPPETIRELRIEWVAGDIVILPADVEEITISESQVSDSKYALTWAVKGDKLEIYHSEDHSFSLIGIHENDYVAKDLYIKVPRNWECDKLEIDAAEATLEIRGITIREVDFDGASGTFDLIDCNIQDLDIDTASGDVTFSGTLDTLDFDAASASFIGEFQNTPSRIDMDGISGSLDIALPEDCGYSLSMDGMSSTFRSDFQGTENKNDVHIYGDGSCVIQVDGMSCDVTIRKLDTVFTEAETP